MKIQSTKLASSIGDTRSLEELLKHSANPSIEVDASDDIANADVISRLPQVSAILNYEEVRQKKFSLLMNIADSAQGSSAAQEFLSHLGRGVIGPDGVPTGAAPAADDGVSIMPIAGGMALGFTGGVGLGMAINALRSSANASGNPVLNGLALGLGLVGTALGANIASGGSFELKLPGVQLSMKG